MKKQLLTKEHLKSDIFYYCLSHLLKAERTQRWKVLFIFFLLPKLNSLFFPIPIFRLGTNLTGSYLFYKANNEDSALRFDLKKEKHLSIKASNILQTDSEFLCKWDILY